VARPPDAAVPPEPRLQPFVTNKPPFSSTPVIDMEQMRAAEEKALHTPGWVDRQKGIVRVPIEVAKQLAVQRLSSVGAPASGAQAPPRAAAPTQEAKP
jgi:hypothetical protein